MNIEQLNYLNINKNLRKSINIIIIITTKNQENQIKTVLFF